MLSAKAPRSRPKPKTQLYDLGPWPHSKHGKFLDGFFFLHGRTTLIVGQCFFLSKTQLYDLGPWPHSKHGKFLDGFFFPT